MAIDDTNKIDAIAADSEHNCLRLLVCDHLNWLDEEVLNEYDHLMLLQEKINADISYLESKQYVESYPDIEFKYAVIDMHFKYQITENCAKFLQTVQDQLGQYGIKIECQVD